MSSQIAVGSVEAESFSKLHYDPRSLSENGKEFAHGAHRQGGRAGIAAFMATLASNYETYPGQTMQNPQSVELRRTLGVREMHVENEPALPGCMNVRAR